jgi:glycosyltransferase involved in cell wall biosynthesis
MKVLLLHNQYIQQGGEDVVVQNELEALQKLLGKENIFEYRVKTNPDQKRKILISILYSIKEYQNIFQLVKKHKIDIVHIHNYFPLLTVSVFKAARDAGAKIIHTAHNYKLWCIAGTFYRDQLGICTLCTKPNNLLSGIRHKCYRNNLLQSAITKLSFWNYKKSGLLNYIDKMIVLSEFQFQVFADLGIEKEKMVLKSNMVHFTPSSIDINNKKDYLFIGRLEYSKGIDFLLSNWKLLPSSFILKIIGTGSLDTQLRSQYAEFKNIVFLGELDKSKVGTSIQHAKYTIQPSLWYETFGLTIIESMMLGTPVIGLNIGTRAEMIETGKNGLLTTEANFIKTIHESVEYEMYEKMCHAAVESALKYQPEHIIQHQLNIYKEVLN